MSQNRIKFLFTIAVIALFYTSCNKTQSSTDLPLPPIYTPSIIINSDNHIMYAFDLSGSNRNWKFDLPAYNFVPNALFAPSPLLYNEMLYVTFNYSDTIYKISSESGKLVKKLNITPYEYFSVVSTPIADGNLIYLATSNDTLYAIDTGSGATKWAFGTKGPIYSSPTIYNGYIYFGGSDGYVYCLDKTTGYPRWVYNAGTGKQFNSSPCIGDPYLYIGCTDSNMYCINDYSGGVVWTYKTQGAIYSSPTVSGGDCIFGSDDHNVYCLDTNSHDTGSRLIWTYLTNDVVRSSPVRYQNTVYVGSSDYNLYAINFIGTYEKTTSTKWRFATNGVIKSSPIYYNGIVYIGSEDKYLYALDTAGGNIIWKTNINGLIECSPVIDNLGGNTTTTNSGISGYTQ